MKTENTVKIAQLLFPDVTITPEELENKYPQRQLPEGAAVTRVAPSPTGFVHIGTIFAAIVPERLAHQSGGVFILRVEDTDKNREVTGGVNAIADALRTFKIPYDEGMWSDEEQVGQYGPYLQSQRKALYAACAKYLVSQGRAYPCFCSAEELEEIRKKQEEAKVRPGYYGEWAKHRDMTVEDVEANLKAGKPFAIRIKSSGEGKLTFQDLIKGSITMPVNDQDYVLLKSDGLATYHFAHPIDDHFMRITHILRGDEWLPSTPLHLQVFQYFGWAPPLIGHFAPIMKTDGASRRKLSKRKDPEANVLYYAEVGFPVEAVGEYMLNIINPNFEDWRRMNPAKPMADFEINLKRMNTSGALFDIVKLGDVAKQVIGKMSPEDVYDAALRWAETFDTTFARLMEQDKDYTFTILSIERDQQGRRKDIAMWSQLRNAIGFFYDTEFATLTKDGYSVPEEKCDDFRKAIEAYLSMLDTIGLPKQEWFEKIKEIATRIGYTTDTKAYKQNPEQFKGSVGDVAMFLRIALTNKTTTPDLQEIMKALGEARVKERLQTALSMAKA